MAEYPSSAQERFWSFEIRHMVKFASPPTRDGQLLQVLRESDRQRGQCVFKIIHPAITGDPHDVMKWRTCLGEWQSDLARAFDYSPPPKAMSLLSAELSSKQSWNAEIEQPGGSFKLYQAFEYLPWPNLVGFRLLRFDAAEIFVSLSSEAMAYYFPAIAMNLLLWGNNTTGATLCGSQEWESFFTPLDIPELWNWFGVIECDPDERLARRFWEVHARLSGAQRESIANFVDVYFTDLVPLAAKDVAYQQATKRLVDIWRSKSRAP